jgi:hypothetical protein
VASRVRRDLQASAARTGPSQANDRPRCDACRACLECRPQARRRSRPSHTTGDGLSARYFKKQVMLISEVNGRISELRGDGIEIETSVERDPYGFANHRLKPMTRADHLRIAADAVRAFHAA